MVDVPQVRQGAIWWADLGDPSGSEPGYTRPVLVIQGDQFNNSRLRTVLVMLLTSNLTRARMPGTVLLRSRQTGLEKDSVAVASQIITLDKTRLRERCGSVEIGVLRKIFAGIDIVLER